MDQDWQFSFLFFFHVYFHLLSLWHLYGHGYGF